MTDQPETVECPVCFHAMAKVAYRHEYVDDDTGDVIGFSYICSGCNEPFAQWTAQDDEPRIWIKFDKPQDEIEPKTLEALGRMAIATTKMIRERRAKRRETRDQ